VLRCRHLPLKEDSLVVWHPFGSISTGIREIVMLDREPMCSHDAAHTLSHSSCLESNVRGGKVIVRGKYDPLGSNLVLRKATQVSFAVFDVFGIRRIINPAVSTANITNLSPKENDPVRVYTYPNM
jgi:hypothetical protein